MFEAVLIKFNLGHLEQFGGKSGKFEAETSQPATVVSVRLNGNLKALWTVVPFSSNVEAIPVQATAIEF